MGGEGSKEGTWRRGLGSNSLNQGSEQEIGSMALWSLPPYVLFNRSFPALSNILGKPRIFSSLSDNKRPAHSDLARILGIIFPLLSVHMDLAWGT